MTSEEDDLSTTWGYLETEMDWVTGYPQTIIVSDTYTASFSITAGTAQVDQILFTTGSRPEENEVFELTEPTFITQVISSELVTQTIALSYDGLNRVTQAQYNGA